MTQASVGQFLASNWQKMLAILVALSIAYLTTLVNARAHPGTVLLMATAGVIAVAGTKDIFKLRNANLLATILCLSLMGLGVYHLQQVPDNGVKSATTVPLILAVAILVAMRNSISNSFKKSIPYLAVLGLIATTGEIAYDYFMQSYHQDGRVAGNMWIGDANVANAVAVAFGLVSFFSFKSKSIKLAIAALISLAFAGAQSRGSFAAIGITFGLLGLFYILTAKLSLSKAKAAGAVGLLSVVLPLVVLIGLIEVSKHMPPNISVLSRVAIIETTLGMIQENVSENPSKLLVGNGFSTWRENYTRFRTSEDINSSGITVHLDYLEYFYEAGLPFTLLFMGTLALTVSALLRKSGQSNVHLGLASATVFAASFAAFNFAFIAPIFSVIVGVALGFALSSGKAKPAGNLRNALRLIGATVIFFVALSAKYSLLIYMVSAKAPLFVSDQEWDSLTFQYTQHLAGEKHFIATSLMAGLLEKQAFETREKEGTANGAARTTAENAASYYFLSDHILPVCNDCKLKIGSIIDAFTDESEIESKKKALQFGYEALELNKTNAGIYFLTGRLELLINNDIKKAEELLKGCIENTISANYVDGLKCLELGNKIVEAKVSAVKKDAN